MGKFTGMLFTSDFDHTISDHKGAIPPANLEAIAYFVREGGRFCLNTGRSIPAARKQALRLPCNAPCLLYNGGACYDYGTDRLIFAHPLPEAASQLLPKLRAPELGIEIQGLEAHYSAAPIPSREPMLKQAGMETVLTDNPPLPWMKIVLCGLEGSVLEGRKGISEEEQAYFRSLEEKVKALCGSEYYVTRSMTRILEIGNPNCTKATGARELQAALSCHTLICAGDAPNDIPMLADGDYCFCPTDAHPDILSLPGIIPTVPTGDGAIACAISYLERQVSAL